MPTGRFLEVLVTAAIDTCRARDPKGHYGRASLGQIAEFTGVSAPYEPPATPELVLDTDTLTPEASVELLIALLSRQGIVPTSS